MKKGKNNTVKKAIKVAAVVAALIIVNKAIESGNVGRYKDI